MPPGAQAKKYIAPWGNFILSRLFFFVNTFFKNFLENFYAGKNNTGGTIQLYAVFPIIKEKSGLFSAFSVNLLRNTKFNLFSLYSAIHIGRKSLRNKNIIVGAAFTRTHPGIGAVCRLRLRYEMVRPECIAPREIYGK